MNARDGARALIIDKLENCPLRGKETLSGFHFCKKEDGIQPQCGPSLHDFPEDCPLSKAAYPKGLFQFHADKRQDNPYWLQGTIWKGDYKIAEIGLKRSYGESADENIAALIGNANLAQVFSGCVGYLRSLPKNVRPDDAWFKPAEEVLAQLEKK